MQYWNFRKSLIFFIGTSIITLVLLATRLPVRGLPPTPRATAPRLLRRVMTARSPVPGRRPAGTVPALRCPRASRPLRCPGSPVARRCASARGRLSTMTPMAPGWWPRPLVVPGPPMRAGMCGWTMAGMSRWPGWC